MELLFCYSMLTENKDHFLILFPITSVPIRWLLLWNFNRKGWVASSRSLLRLVDSRFVHETSWKWRLMVPFLSRRGSRTARSLGRRIWKALYRV